MRTLEDHLSHYAAYHQDRRRVTDLDENRLVLPYDTLKLHTGIPRHVQPSLVLLCVKSGATAGAAQPLDERLPESTLGSFRCRTACRMFPRRRRRRRG